MKVLCQEFYRHMLEHDSGTITAFRSARDCNEGEKYSKGENKARNKVLLSQLLKKGYSVTAVKGRYIENYGSTDEREVGENVFLVVDIKDSGKLKQDLLKLGEEYEQDSILFIPKGANNGFLIGTNKCENGYPGYRKQIKLKNPVFGQKGEFFTRVNGRPFVLKESLNEKTLPKNNNGLMALTVMSKQGWKVYYDENKEILEKE